MRPLKLFVMVILGLAMLQPARSLQAASITLNPVADTTLSQHDPTNNLGKEPTLFAGATFSTLTNRALLKFDVASRIPANSLLQNVTLTITVVKTPATTPSLFSLHRVLRDWGEGTGLGLGAAGGNLGAPATAGAATFLARFHPDALWSAPGAAAPGDFVTTASATQSIAGIASYTFSSSNLVLDVRSWLTNTGTNFGWILICEDELTFGEARRFGSREDKANSPTLELEYVPGAQIEHSEVIGSKFRFSFISDAGHVYSVQSRDSLTTGNWTTLTNLPATPAPRTNVISTSIIGPERFYRVALH